MKQMAITLIDEAVAAGARLHKACAVLGISSRTHRRWKAAEHLQDARQGAAKHCPHALSDAERQTIIAACNAPEHQNLPPSQIVPRLADRGIYLASESSFYRVLRAQGQHNRRGRAKAPRQRARPQAFAAQAPNQVWSWDITYLPSTVKGQFWRLYMIVDIYSQRHAGLDAAILQQRHGTYIRARSERPERWNGRTTRNWEPVAQVWLNPEREREKPTMEKMPKAA